MSRHRLAINVYPTAMPKFFRPTTCPRTPARCCPPHGHGMWLSQDVSLYAKCAKRLKSRPGFPTTLTSLPANRKQSTTGRTPIPVPLHHHLLHRHFRPALGQGKWRGERESQVPQGHVRNACSSALRAATVTLLAASASESTSPLFLLQRLVHVRGPSIIAPSGSSELARHGYARRGASNLLQEHSTPLLMHPAMAFPKHMAARRATCASEGDRAPPLPPMSSWRTLHGNRDVPWHNFACPPHPV